MKQIQKISAIILALSLLLISLTACNDKGPQPRSASEVGKDAVSMVETNLTEDEMRAAIDSYAAALTDALASGNATAKFVDNKDGSIALIVQPDGIDQTQELMKFGSVAEAFAYFVYTQQIDAQGDIITPPVVQTVPGGNPAPSDLSASTYESDVADENMSPSADVDANEAA